MPKDTKVHRCKKAVMKSGKPEGSAIAICQASTGQSYSSGKPIEKARDGKEAGFLRRVQAKK